MKRWPSTRNSRLFGLTGGATSSAMGSDESRLGQERDVSVPLGLGMRSCLAKARRGGSHLGRIAVTLFVVQSCSAFASNKIPLPQSRPMEAPASARHSTTDKKMSESSTSSACQLALIEHIAIAPIVPPIQEPGGCGGDDLVRLESIILQNGARVPLRPAAIVRCPLAKAIADWVRDDVALLVDVGMIREIDIAGSYECRDRNRVSGERLSEHARANAIDVVGISLRSGVSLSFTDRRTWRELREKARISACSRFPTVLGPGSDGYHEDHIHLDLLERKSGYRICQWNVLSP